MGVARPPSAASTSRHADVNGYPYSRQGTGRQLQPKQTNSNYGRYQTFDQVFSPEAPLTSPVHYSANPLSPGARSWDSAASSESGTSYDLICKRGVSAAFYTPTSSTHASPTALSDTSVQSHQFHAEHQRYITQLQPDYPSDSSLTPPAVLRGLELPLKEAPLNGPRSYPAHNTDVVNYQIGIASPPPPKTRTGVRCGPLSPDARENAGAVRDSGGSCIRCTIMRERCDTGIPCGRCSTVSERARSWKLPCSRKWLNDRGVHLLPVVFQSQLSIAEVNEFINSRSFFPLDDSIIDLPLWVGFGQPLIIEAEEVDPIGIGLMTMTAFAPGKMPNILSPPLRPRGHVDFQAILSKVRSWMSDLIATETSQWPELLFDPSCHPTWQRHTLDLIFQHYTFLQSPKDDTCIFTQSLRLSITSYVMSHALTVPTHLIPAILSRIHHPAFRNLSVPHGHHLSARAISRCIKAILYKLLNHLATSTAELIHAQLGPKADKSATFEAAFTASFLLLTVAAKTQTSLHERAEAGRAQNDVSYTTDDACRDIHHLETEFVQYVVHLFHLRYRAKKGKDKDKARSPASGSPSSTSTAFFPYSPPPSPTFRDSLQGILQREKETIRHANRELGVAEAFDETLFQGSGVRNITRVLARLCAPLIED